MNGFRQLYCDIAASLYWKPATYKELCSRDFLKNKSPYGIDLAIRELENKGWLYYKGLGDNETMHVYKRIKHEKQMLEYQLYA